MSGGDSGSKKKKTEEPAPATPATTLQAFMPGFDTMIAQQLGMGGYGNPSDLLAYMNSVQTPMQIPTNSLPPPSAPSKDKTKGGGGGFRDRMAYVQNQMQNRRG